MLTLVDDDTTMDDYKKIASKNTKAVFMAMVILFFSGTYIFNFFGISPDGLRVFGGIILLFMGINMVQGHDKKVNHRPQEQAAAQERTEISVVPLAIPIIVGPGLASTLINLSTKTSGWESYLEVILAIIVCCIANFIILKRMPYIKKRLGVNGLKVFNRLLGLIVGSLAAQMFIIGLLGLYKTYFAS